MDSLGPPPTTTGRDKFVEVARAAAGEVPVLGSVAEVLVQIFGTGYERRHEAWTRQLWSLMVDLERRSLDLSDLAERPGFVSAVHEASRIALGEHLGEKLEMLQAVLLSHAVGGDDRSADIAALRYLRLVDLLEPEHVEVLRVCFPVDTPRHRDHQPAPEQSDASEISLPSDRPIEPPDAGHIELSYTDVSLIIGELERQLLVEVRALGRRYQPADRVPGNYILTEHGVTFLGWLAIV